MIVLLHCILNYPQKITTLTKNDLSFKIKFSQKSYDYSDHTLPSKQMESLTAAYLLGAKVLEKHFTLNKFKK